MTDEKVDAFLEHYGVKGMRWGVRKDNRSRSERKADRKEAKVKSLTAKADLLDTKIKELQVPPRFKIQRGYRNQKIYDLTVERDRARSDAEKVSQGKLTSRQKKAVVGTAVVGALLVTYGTYQAYQGGDFNRLAIKGQAFLNGQKPGFKKNSSLSDKNLDVDEVFSRVVKGVNPEYGAWGTKDNCRRATFAYEMRRRGFDVTATKTSNARGQDIFGFYTATSPDKADSTGFMFRRLAGVARDARLREYLTEQDGLGEKLISKGGAKGSQIFSELSKLPNGARGELGMLWDIGGGHSMAWEVIKGQPVIFDTQSGKAYKTAADIAGLAKDMSQVAYTRLDNKTLNEDFLLKWMKDAG